MLIAQLSDSHVFPDAPGLVALERAIDQVNALGVDVTLFSGDLGNPPHADAYPLAQKALQRLKSPFYPVPGNVDDRDGLRALFAGTVPLPETGPLTYEVALAPDLRLLALDTIVPGEVRGDFTPETANWLDKKLAGSEVPALVMLHQNPFKTRFAEFDTAMCANADRLVDILAAHPGRVVAVTCGHGHRPIVTELGAVRAFMCPSLRPPFPLAFHGADAPAVTDPPGFMIHDWRDGALVSHFVHMG